MLPDDASAGESRPAGQGATLPVAGVLTLAATTLFEHAPEASVHASGELSGAGVARVAPACPLGAQETPCSGRGSCEDGACKCHAGFSGQACEAGCAGGCGSYGTCESNTCVCADGYMGANCNISSCHGGCTAKGASSAGQRGCPPSPPAPLFRARGVFLPLLPICVCPVQAAQSRLPCLPASWPQLGPPFRPLPVAFDPPVPDFLAPMASRSH